MSAAASKPRFGSVLEISKPEWEQEVQRAPEGVYVVIVLYQGYIPVCEILLDLLN